ncbi:MAG: hypothetical protein AB1896_13655 [Thermodesulfobacteriota bacterium]
MRRAMELFEIKSEVEARMERAGVLVQEAVARFTSARVEVALAMAACEEKLGELGRALVKCQAQLEGGPRRTRHKEYVGLFQELAAQGALVAPKRAVKPLRRIARKSRAGSVISRHVAAGQYEVRLEV